MNKEIEEYGKLSFTPKGRHQLKEKAAFEIPINHDYSAMVQESQDYSQGQGAALDPTLLKLLEDLLDRESQKRDLPPFVIFQEASLNDMATQYPTSMEDMERIAGVNKGKARRFARPFIDLIAQYVEENDIEKPEDFVVKQVANKSKIKVEIIKGTDRKIPLEDIASANHLSFEELLHEMYMIVVAGTKINIDYYLEDNVDEYAKEDIYDYFLDADSDSADAAFQELKEDDITLEEIKLVRLKFLSDLGN